ncbi:MAG: adenylate/guanylate cyclase domain-containing protein, partial [Actinobacteria bacterium]|nr:adenylate/guanylate cyclase domain-containing protein [Actinomycetota bacterium]
LSPNDIQGFFVIGELALAHWMLGQHAEAIAEADQSLIRRPAYWYAAVVKINSLVATKNLPAARRTLDELLAVKSDFSSSYIEWIPFIDKRWNQKLAEGLSKVFPGGGGSGSVVRLRA